MHYLKRINTMLNMNNNERLDINSELLGTFLSIAKCGNLTVAAGQLDRTQSAISVQLRKLESGLGVSLFERTSKGMVLTDAGNKLLPKARIILSEIKEASLLFANPLTGSIRVGLPDDFDETVLECMLSTFANAHPGVNVLATSGCTSGYAKAIDNGAMDIAVCSGPDNGKGETLAIEETVWASKKNARFSREKPVPLAILDRECWWGDLPIKALEGEGRDYTIAFRSSSFASIQAAIRSGIAIGILPGTCVTEGIQRLACADGFPELPRSRRSILIATDAQSTLTNAMAAAIREARYSNWHDDLDRK